MLKIALVSPYDMALAGGVNEHVRQLYRQFRRCGHEARVLAPSSAPASHSPDFYSVGRITPVQINGSVARISLSLNLAPRIKAILRSEQFDVVHLHEPFSPTFCTTTLSCSTALNIGTFHAAAERSVGYATGQRWLLRLAPLLHGRIAVSPAARQLAQRYFPGTYRVIPNGVDVQIYNPQTEPLPVYDDGLMNLLFVGRYNDERKGFRYLLEALALVREALPRVRLLVVGTGDPTPFRSQMRQLRLPEIVFTGYVDQPTLARYYRSAQLFCAPSIGQESFGMVLLEAMATGCPIVATDIAGYRQVVEHRRQALLVQPRNHEALAVAILQVLQDEQLRNALAQDGLRKAQLYSWEHIATQVLNLYEQVAANHMACMEVTR